ncbi:TPA: hypothetical protein KQG29_001656 [Clostridioides difficile]|nr:hypothetical protein [Clostridioides difficile]
MNELLKIVLSLSLSGALLILVLLLCKPLVKDKLSKRWQYYIWLIVVVRLLLPFAPETNLMGTIFQHFDNAVIQMDTSPRPEQEPSVLPEQDFLDHAGNGEGEHSEPDKVAAPSIFEMVKQNTAVFCLLVWSIVAACLLIRKVTVYQSFVKYIKAGRIEISDMQLWERVGKLVEQTGIKGAVGLYTNSLISSPLLIGFFRPCIMLPTTELSESDFENTILHELTHYKRRDMFYKWLVQVTICFHWFNPLVYLMGREVNRACELSCDEAVIKSLDDGGRRAYGDTLLNVMGMGGNYKENLASVTLYEGKILLKERLDAIMTFKKKSGLVKCATILLTILLLCGFSFIGVYAANFKVDTNNQFHSINSSTTILNNEHEITTIDVQATVGNLTVVYGDKSQIEIGPKLINHASFSFDNGTLIYRDDFGKNNVSFDDTNGEEYNITITIPNDLQLKTLSVDVGIGSVDLQNIKAVNAKLIGTTRINLNGFHSRTLDLSSTLADITATDISILQELSLRSYGSTAIVSGEIKGNVLIDSAGISNTNITFVNSDRKNYFIKSTWEPESSNKELGNLLLENGDIGLLIDREKYSVEYNDTNLDAPYKFTVISRELMPMENITINFAK